jgi:hypothetical protein
MGRRAFLGAVAGTGLGAFVAASGVAPRVHPAGANAPSDAAGAGGAIAPLGQRYLTRHPRERSVERLLELVPGFDPARAAEAQLTEFRFAVEADFAHGRTVSVDGWRLSRTGARLAALAALGR